jgi:hypothetical protein
VFVVADKNINQTFPVKIYQDGNNDWMKFIFSILSTTSTNIFDPLIQLSTIEPNIDIEALKMNPSKPEHSG